MATSRDIQLIGMREAMRLHRKLNIDLSRRIDVFGATASMGIPLMFKPLKRLSGAYLAEAGGESPSPGIMVSSLRPLSHQRFTTAHELCHHIRDDETMFDSETEVFRRASLNVPIRERIAEAFAGWFLMPKPLVSDSLARIGVFASGLTPQNAYSLSLLMGTSYSATIHHLRTANLITAASLSRLAEVKPQTVKRELFGFKYLATSWNNVWDISASLSGSTIFPEPGDVLSVALEEAPSTGYVWEFADNFDEDLELVDSDFTPQSELFGAAGQRKLAVRVAHEARHEITLGLVRPWLRADPTTQVKLQVVAQARPVGIEPRSLVGAGAR